MADEKDPKEEAAAEEKPKRRAPRRKPKADAAPAKDASSTPEGAAEATPAAAEEPVAEAAAEAAPAKAKAARATKAKAGDDAPEPAAEEKPAPARRTRRKAADDKPAEPAAKPKRAPREYGDTPPMVRAHAKYVRTSARKARLVCDHIRGKSVPEARAILAHASRDVARDWSKLLESAVANAEHNHELIGDELRIHAVKADEGPTLKRFRPRAMGRATKIRKRTSHLSIILTPNDRDR